MNDVYGIDPKAPSNLAELSALVRLFSPSEGRFISDFPMGWNDELRNHMKSISDGLSFATVEAWIRLGKHALLPSSQQYKSNLTWVENSAFIREEVVKLIGSSTEKSKIIDQIDKILLDPNAFRDSRGDFIPRTALAYGKISSPILLRSRKVVLVDPFITFRFLPQYKKNWQPDRRRNVVKEMFKIAQKGRFVECFEIFYEPVNQVYGAEYLQEDLQNLVDELGIKSIDVACHPTKKDSNTKQHARYLLGLHSGLHFDHGFDTAEDDSRNHIEWMGNSVLEPLLKKFT
jgi:hypothetical protein